MGVAVTRPTLHDPNPMNKFYTLGKDEALAVACGLRNGETFPEVTLWRLCSYVETAMWIGTLVGQGKITVPAELSIAERESIVGLAAHASYHTLYPHENPESSRGAAWWRKAAEAALVAVGVLP